MAYKKGSGGPDITSVRGMCSYPDGTGSRASRVKPECGPGGNADQQKANRLLQEAQRKVDSLRGESGM